MMYVFINNLNLDFLTIMRIIIDRCKHGRLRDINKQGKTKYGPDNINTGSLLLMCIILGMYTWQLQNGETVV